MSPGLTTIVVIPCYNEAKRFQPDSVLDYVASRPWLRFLLVDDGSTDNTAAVLAQTASSGGAQVEALLLTPNGGKAEAVRRGILHAMQQEPDVVGFWDADLATPLEDIEGFVRIFDDRPEVEIVIGSRVQLLGRDIHRNPRRHYFGRVAATIASNLLGLRVYDTQCGAKLFRSTPTLPSLFRDPFVTRWIFDVEVFARWLAGHQGVNRETLSRRIVEIPLQQWDDVAGSQLTSKDMLQAPTELLKIYMKYRRDL